MDTTIEQLTRDIEEGKALYGRGEYAGALAIFRAVLSSSPESFDALFESGKTCLMLERPADAIGYLERAAVRAEGDTRRLFNISFLRAKALKTLGDYSEATAILERLRATGESADDVSRELDHTHRERYGPMLDPHGFGGYDGLAAEYERRLAANPRDDRSLVHLAQTYNFLGAYDRTITLLEARREQWEAFPACMANRALNEREIAQKRTVLASKVRGMVVTLSNRCNIACTMCLTSKHPWELPAARQKELCALFPTMEKIMWQGGEVFFLDYFLDLLREGFKHPHLRQSIVTNGQLITPAVADELVRHNVELTFSVDGVTAPVYEAIRRGARFDRLVDTLRLVAGLRADHRSSFVMNMNVVIMKSNYRELESFLDFAAQHGCEFLCLMPINTHLATDEDIFSRNDQPALQFIAARLPPMMERARALGIRLESRLPVPLPAVERPADEAPVPAAASVRSTVHAPDAPLRRPLRCHLPWHQLLLDYDGTIRPDCQCSIAHTAGSAADITIADAWNGPALQRYRARMVADECAGLCSEHCMQHRIAETHLKFI